VRRRALGLLDAGRAPVAWLRDTERAGARLHALERATAWTGALAAVRPALREGPLLGGALGALASADPRAAPTSAADAPAPPANPARRFESAPRARRRSAARESAQSAESVDTAAPRARTPGERRAAASTRAAHHRPRPAQLPRRAGEGVLRGWSERADPSPAHASRSAGWSSGLNAHSADAMEWDALVRRAARAALAASPQALPALPALGLPDRLRGWRQGGSRPGSPAAPALPPFDPRFADAADAGIGGAGGGDRWIGTVARRAHRRFLRTAGVRTEGGSVAALGMDAAAPHRPHLADAAERMAAADPHRPHLADGGSDSIDPHRPWLADAADGVDGARPLAREWGAPLDGPTAPAEVLARLANGRRTRAAGQGSGADSVRRAPADAAASLLRQARRGTASAADESADRDADAASSTAPDERPRGHRALHVPSLVRELADRAVADEGARSAIRALHTPHGLLRPAAHPLLAGGRSVAGRPAAVEVVASPEDGRDRWLGWPAVLPWPRGLRAPAEAHTPRTRPPAAPRRPADAASGAGQGTPPAAEAEDTPRGPVAGIAEPYRPGGPPPPQMTPGPYPPRAAILGEAAPDRAAVEAERPPAPLATGEGAAPWTEGWGAPLRSLQAAHPFAREAEPAADELDDALARRLKRILDDEARRYGIDV
jgi:hypothetical protein